MKCTLKYFIIPQIFLVLLGCAACTIWREIEPEVIQYIEDEIDSETGIRIEISEDNDEKK